MVKVALLDFDVPMLEVILKIFLGVVPVNAVRILVPDLADHLCGGLAIDQCASLLDVLAYLSFASTGRFVSGVVDDCTARVIFVHMSARYAY